MDVRLMQASQEEEDEALLEEAEEQYRNHLNEFTLLECFDRYSDPNDAELRRALEIIEHLYPGYSLGTFLEEREVIVKQLMEYHPDLMTQAFIQRLCFETDRYAERLR